MLSKFTCRQCQDSFNKHFLNRVQARHCARQWGWRDNYDTVLIPDRPYCWVALGKPLASLWVPVVLGPCGEKCANNVRGDDYCHLESLHFPLKEAELKSRISDSRPRLSFWSPGFQLSSVSDFLVAKHETRQQGDTDENDLQTAGMAVMTESSDPKVKGWRHWILDDSVKGFHG